MCRLTSITKRYIDRPVQVCVNRRVRSRGKSVSINRSDRASVEAGALSIVHQIESPKVMTQTTQTAHLSCAGTQDLGSADETGKRAHGKTGR